MGDEGVASGEISMAARPRRTRAPTVAAPAAAALRSTLRSALRSLVSIDDDPECISVGILAVNPDSIHDETVTEPSIQALDSATHLAAYRESRLGMLVSVPVSCDAMDITWQRIPRKVACCRRAASTVSCRDNDRNASGSSGGRVRGYNIRSPGCGERRLRSLHSRVIGAPKRRIVEHVAEQAQVGDVEAPEAACDRGQVAQVALGRSLVHPLQRSLAFHECIRALKVASKSIGRTEHRDPVLEGQLRVASRELGWSLARSTVMTPVPCPQTATTVIEANTTCRNYIVPMSTTVVVGGTNGIGQAMAGWVAARGPCSGDTPDPLLLVGRRGVLGAVSSTSILKSGLCVVSSLDCSRRTDAGELLGMCTLAGVARGALVHAAGVIHDEAFLASTARSWRTVFAPKYNGMLAVSSIAAALPI
jgi:hypothetical protein